MEIAPAEETWLRDKYPYLFYDKNAQRLIGDLPINCFWDNPNLISRADGEAQSHTNFCQGKFLIEIHLSKINPDSGLPETYETEGRHRKIAQNASPVISQADLHMNNDEGNCCLYVLSRYEERSLKIDLKTFLEDYVIPFFYRLLYVEQYGLKKARKELWNERMHGKAGRVQADKEMWEKILLAHPEDRCPCGRNSKSKNCCKPIIYIEDYCLPPNLVEQYILNFPHSYS